MIQVDVHLHECAELISVERGDAILRCGPQPRVINAPAVVVVPPLRAHALDATRADCQTSAIESVGWWTLAADGLPHGSAIPCLVMHPHELIAPIDSTVREALHRSARMAAASDVDGLHPSVLRGLAFLECETTRRCSVSEVADAGGMSRWHFSRLFSSALGLPPRAWQEQRWIARSVRLLASGSSISDVAYRAGFADQSHFTRVFKRCVGETPARFARRQRAAACSAMTG